MSAPSTTTEPVQVYYGVSEVADNPDISNFSFETVIPVVIFNGDRHAVRVRSTWIGLEEIRGHIAWLEERALQAEADLRYANIKLDVEAARLHAAERAAQDANEGLRSLRSDQFACETLVPVGDVDGSGNVWVRLRSTEDGVGLLLKQLSRLDERAVLAEAALQAANARARMPARTVPTKPPATSSEPISNGRTRSPSTRSTASASLFRSEAPRAASRGSRRSSRGRSMPPASCMKACWPPRPGSRRSKPSGQMRSRPSRASRSCRPTRRPTPCRTAARR